MKVTVNWKHGMSFEGGTEGHSVKTDTTTAGGGSNTGMSPKQLLLVSVCGCTGMDVADMLEKMRVPFTRLDISAEAEQTQEHPKVFEYINITYYTDAGKEYEDKVKGAIELSQTKYCGVSIMLKKHCPVNYELKFY